MAKTPPPAKKRGCCGCGCTLLALLALLLAGLVGGSLYLTYASITTPATTTIPAFDGGDDVYSQAREKITGFNHDLQNHIPASIHLSADEINTLIVRNPDFAKNNMKLFVTLTGDQARMQMSAPLGVLNPSLPKDRFLNIDMTFGVNLDLDSRNLNFTLQSLQTGPQDWPKNDLPLLQSWLNPAFNQQLMRDPAAKSLINRASSIQIKNGELVIETK